MLIPLGTSLLNKVNYSHLVFPWSENNGPYYTFIFGLMLCLAPVIVLAYWFFCGDKDPDTKKISWEFFRIDSQENYTQDITEDGERTSIEFEDYFRQIINTAIKNHNIEKIIIVIDNLDRVTPEHAKNVWSTLQTFFQLRSTTGTTETWPDQVWFIVPFDRDGFKKIWNSDDNDKKISDSFLKKCFQLVAEVPHPVMSGWSQYVEKCINLSLHKWPLDEKQKVVSTYIRYASRLDKSPTPRDIRIFVNQVGLLGSMWGNETSVEAMSLYVLLRENSSTDQLRSSLISNDALGNYQPDTERSVLLPQLAGLLFGVNSNKGLQLLLAPEIHSAFKTGDGNALKKLSQDHNNAFWIAYEASKDLWELTMEKTDDYKYSFTTALFLGLVNSRHKIKREINCLPKIWIDSYPSLNFDSNDYSSVINYTFQLCGDNNFLKKIKELTTEKISQEISKIDNEAFSVKVFRNLLSLIELLKEHQYKIEPKVNPKLNCKNWMLWLEKINDEKISFNLVLPKKQAIIDLANEVQFSYSKLEDQALDHLIQTYKIHPTSNEWDEVTNSIVSWLNMSNRDVDCEKIYDFALKLVIGDNDEISDKITNCIDGSDFWYNMEDASISKNPSLPILTALSIQQKLQNHDFVSSAVKSYWNNSIDKNSTDEIYNKLKEINSLYVLWLLSRDCNNAVAIEIVKKYVTPELYGDLNGVRFIDEFTWADEKTISEIAHNLIVHGAFIKNQPDMVDRATIYDKVYQIFYSLNDKNTSHFIDSETN
ncbi:TPA: P-loop NTPase fold protein, partial [Aeromonas salmonicida]